MNEIVLTLEGDADYSTDAEGNETARIEPKTVIGVKKSVYANEFFNAGMLDIKPSCMVEIYTSEYNGAKTVRISGLRMTVYRTYEKGERTELYLTEKRGDSG